MTGISIFDVDRTLTRRPTYSLFLLGSAWRAAPWRLTLIPVVALVAIPFAMKLVPRRRMKEVMHALLLGRRVPRERVNALAEAFSDRLARAGLYPEGVSLIAAEHAAGRRVMLATAAPAFYIEPLAAELGIVDIVATASIWEGEYLTPGIGGENCYGTCKRDRVSAHLAAVGIDRAATHVRFYSDHPSDLPTFEWSDEPVAVNPSAPLRELALARGWTILDWRSRPGSPSS